MIEIPTQVAFWINDTIRYVLSDDDNTGDIDREGARKTLVWLNAVLIERVNHIKLNDALLREIKESNDARQDNRT